MPDEVYRVARIKAAERGTSVSAIVRDQLMELAKGEEDKERGRRILATIESVRREQLAAGRTGFKMSDNLSREELYEDAVRRH